MLFLIFYFFLLIFLFIFTAFMAVLFAAFIYSSYMGSPYIPTKQKEIDFILKEAKLQARKTFLELGCGDARVVKTAISKYKVKGKGVDINPLLVFWAKILAKIQKINDVGLEVNDIFKTDISDADYIYLFLIPNLLKKLAPMMKKKLKENTLVISHGFKVPDWKKYLTKTIYHQPFPTYFYKI